MVVEPFETLRWVPVKVDAADGVKDVVEGQLLLLLRPHWLGEADEQNDRDRNPRMGAEEENHVYNQELSRKEME